MDNRNRRTPIANSSVQQSKPQAHSSQPQVRSSQPQVRSSQPHARSSQPQVRSSQPHARSSQPQIRSKQHNRRLPSPELDLDFSALSLRDNDTPSYAVARTQQRFPQAHRSEPVTAIRTKPYLGRKHFFNLPIEIQIQIFSHLDLISRIRLLKTSKRTREISLASSWSILDFPLFRRLKNEDVVKFLVGTLTPLARSMVHELNLSNALPENSTNFSCVGSSLRLLPNLRVFKCRGYPLPKIREQFLKLERHNPAVRLRLRRFECAPARLQSDGIGDIRRVLYALAEGPIELDAGASPAGGGFRGRVGYAGSGRQDVTSAEQPGTGKACARTAMRWSIAIRAWIMCRIGSRPNAPGVLGGFRVVVDVGNHRRSIVIMSTLNLGCVRRRRSIMSIGVLGVVVSCNICDSN
ncbi:hypothetical protein BC938DRAFT_473983, partial [Jimgerdemannia flammicorona]